MIMGVSITTFKHLICQLTDRIFIFLDYFSDEFYAKCHLYDSQTLYLKHKVKPESMTSLCRSEITDLGLRGFFMHS